MGSAPLTAPVASALLRSRAISSVELLQETLARLDRCEPVIGAFITVCRDSALRAARAADKLFAAGHDLGPLQGMPLAVKDNIDTAGVRTTMGSAVFADNVPAADAAVVRALGNAGAVLVGKTNMHEFAVGGTTVGQPYGTTRNPWDPTRFAAGSSGGSAAAVAAGECIVALGTDTGGSVRLPAAMTGLTGLRPTFGRVSTAGVFPLSRTVDTVGPMARSVDEVALLFRCLAGLDPVAVSGPTRPDRPQPLAGIRVGLLADFATTGLEPGVLARFTEALRDLTGLGADVVELEPPAEFDHWTDWHRVRLAETARLHRPLLARHADAYGAQVRDAIERGDEITAAEYEESAMLRARLRTRFDALLEKVDVIVTPTAPFVATPVDQDWVDIDGRRAPLLPTLVRYTNLASCLGLPALSVPCGFVDGLPAGLQLIGRRSGEAELFDVGRAYEAVNDWHLRVAPMSTGR